MEQPQQPQPQPQQEQLSPKEQEKRETEWYLRDPETKKKSVSLTFFALGFVIACGKLIFSGVDIHGVVLSPFTGMDFAAVIGALGAVYAVRKNQDKGSK